MRIPSELKAKLELQAANEGIKFPVWMRMHLQELLQQYPGQIVVEEKVGIRMPYPYSPYPYGSNYPSTVQQPYYTPHLPYQHYPLPQSHMDRFLEEMTKMVQIKMMKELLQDRATPEAFIRAAQSQGVLAAPPKEDSFDWDKYMKYQMMSQQNERQMMQAMQQLEIAKGTGDKGAQNQAVQLITALMANQSAQQQQFMQNFMATQQASQTAQSNLFTAALQGSRTADVESRTREREFSAQIEGTRNQFMQMQLQTLNQMNQMHVNWLTQRMEEIKQKKDTVQQISELLELRQKSPVYKAAFDAAFGVREESMIGKIVPQLKDLGVDKLVEKIGVFLAGLVMKPKIPAPTLPTPTMLPPTATVPIPEQPEQPLETLKLPPIPGQLPAPTEAETETPTEFTATPQPPEEALKPPPIIPLTLPESAIGYTNVEAIEKEETETPPPNPTKTTKPTSKPKLGRPKKQ